MDSNPERNAEKAVIALQGMRAIAQIIDLSEHDHRPERVCLKCECEKVIKDMEMDRKPAEVFHPGEHLRNELEARGLSMNDFARKCIYPKWFIRKVINGKENINNKIAETFGKALGTSPEFWMNLQRAWDEFQERSKQ